MAKKSCYFSNIVENSDEGKYLHSGYGATDSGIFARNGIIFGADISSSSHSDNRKNNFLIIGEGPTFVINGGFGSPEKNISFTTANTKFYLNWHYNVDNSYLFVNEKEIFKSKANNEKVNFLTQFFLRSISNGFSGHESREVFLNRNMYDLPVEYNFIDKSDILNIHKWIRIKMNKNNMK